MASEFDHVFICVSVGGEEASALAAFGLNEGTPNLHPGQGTACRRFFFANSYLELLWVNDAVEAQSTLIQPTHLWERWIRRANGVCPIGLGFRPKTQHDGGAPFSSWEYRPPYLAAPLSLHVATNANVLAEPMLFYLPFGLRPDGYPGAKRPLLAHRAGLREVTRVELTSPHVDRLSPEMAVVTRAGLAQLRAGLEYLVELGFDGETQGQHADFRPLLPLVFRW
jgi:hypothetical protein